MIQEFSVASPTRSQRGETSAYVLGETDGLLVDPAGRRSDLDGVVADRVSHVAVTHYHPDHVGAVKTYTEEWDLEAWALSGRCDGFESATGVDPDRVYFPGETLPVAGGIEVLDTPGHAPEHVSFVVPSGIVTGDVAVRDGTVVVGAPAGDMRAYLTSLRRLSARDPDRLYPAHGPLVDAPRGTCERLIRHRRDRERRVLAAVAAGNETPDAIVGAAYDKDVTAVYDLAKATVIAHLEKLAVEGAVTLDGETAMLA